MRSYLYINFTLRIYAKEVTGLCWKAAAAFCFSSAVDKPCQDVMPFVQTSYSALYGKKIKLYCGHFIDNCYHVIVKKFGEMTYQSIIPLKLTKLFI